MKLSRVLVVATALLSVTVLASGQSKDPYRVFNQYRAMAVSGRPYRGAPLKGRVIGFANIVGSLPFCVSTPQTSVFPLSKITPRAMSSQIGSGTGSRTCRRRAKG